MCRCIILLFAIVCICLSQTAPLIVTPETPSYGKSLSMELFGGTHLTLEHWMPYRGITLPACIWGGGGRIKYQPLRHVILSLSGGYDYARYLAFFSQQFIIPPDIHLTYVDIDVQMAYTSRISADVDYHLGAGMGVSYMRLQEVYVDYYTDVTYDSTVTNINLRPVVSTGVKIKITDRLFSQLQVNCHIYQIFVSGEENIHMNDILPSISLGFGYMVIKQR